MRLLKAGGVVLLLVVCPQARRLGWGFLGGSLPGSSILVAAVGSAVTSHLRRRLSARLGAVGLGLLAASLGIRLGVIYGGWRGRLRLFTGAWGYWPSFWSISSIGRAGVAMVISLTSLGMYLKAEYTVCRSRCGRYLLYAARRASSSFLCLCRGLRPQALLSILGAQLLGFVDVRLFGRLACFQRGV